MEERRRKLLSFVETSALARESFGQEVFQKTPIGSLLFGSFRSPRTKFSLQDPQNITYES